MPTQKRRTLTPGTYTVVRSHDLGTLHRQTNGSNIVQLITAIQMKRAIRFRREGHQPRVTGRLLAGG